MYMGSDVFDEDKPSGHPNLTPEINAAIAQSEIEGGVFLKNVPVGKALLVQTRNTQYRLENREDGWYISGHARYCPEPIKAYIAGSTWGGSMLKIGFVGRGMHLEFSTDTHRGAIATSTIQDITEAS